MEIMVTLNGQPLAAADFYARALVISLFTWRQAQDGDPVDDAVQGWWAEGLSADLPAGIGSRLWLLARRALTDDTVRDAKDYIEEALAWWTETGVATQVMVTLQRVGTSTLVASIAIALASGETLTASMADVWSLVNG